MTVEEGRGSIQQAPVKASQNSHGEEAAAACCQFTTMTGSKQPPHRVLMENWQSAVTVAMVSVPLSISLGIASVAGDDPAAPTMGVATAFWGGLTAGLFGSSDHNIVGPAGALSGMLNSYTIQFGGAGVLPYLSLISAVFCFFVYLLNLQRYLLLMPKAVFEGFTLAVAIIIGFNQLNMAFDLKPNGPKHEHFYENVIESFKVLDQAQAAPAIFFFVTCGTLLSLAKYLPKIRGYSIPWTVIIPLLTLIFGYLSNTDNFGGVELPTLKDKYGTLKARIIEPPFNKPLSHYAKGNVGGIVTASFGVAFVAVLETLISAKIAEQKTDWSFDASKEGLGVALCHAVCGAVGAMPPTGVFVRTALNFQLGATHKASQVLNAVVVFIISVLAMPVFSYLPQASVAALLVYASVRMAPIYYIMELWRNDKGSCGLLTVTTLICVFMDPVYGLVVGMVVALLRDAAETSEADSRLTTWGQAGKQILKPMEITEPNEHSHAGFSRSVSGESKQPQRSLRTVDYDVDAGLGDRLSPIQFLLIMIQKRGFSKQAARAEANIEDDLAGGLILYEPIGPVVYLAADRHSARLKALLNKKPNSVVLSLELASRVDVDGSAALAKGVKELQKAGVAVDLVVPPQLEGGVLGRASWLSSLRKQGHVFQHRSEALKAPNEERAPNEDDDSRDSEGHPSVQVI